MRDILVDSLTWSAPVAGGCLDAVVRVPGSKSETARAIFIAACAVEPTQIFGALVSRDTELMMQALSVLGAQFSWLSDGSLLVTPIRDFPDGDLHIDVGLAGTVMRFVPLLAALRPGVTYFDGDEQAYARPLSALFDVIRSLGARVTCHGVDGFLPFSVEGVDASAALPREIWVDGTSSSQFVSAVLLVSPVLLRRDGVARTIRALGEVPSLPHVQMTCEVLRDRGVSLSQPSCDDLAWVVDSGVLRGGTVRIAPDLTNAGVFLAAAMLCGGRVHIEDWPTHTTQPGQWWGTFFTDLGGRCALDDTGLTLSVDSPHDSTSGLSFPTFSGMTVDMSDFGELTITAVAVLLFASSPSSIRGVGHIRGHETDRLRALATEIGKLGGQVVEHDDGLDIVPVALSGAHLSAYADHRMAMFAALVGLRIHGVTLDDVASTSKTFPNFPDAWVKCVGARRCHSTDLKEDV